LYIDLNNKRHAFADQHNLITASQLCIKFGFSEKDEEAGVRLKLLIPQSQLSEKWYPKSIQLTDAEIVRIKEEAYLTRSEIQKKFEINNYQWPILMKAGLKPVEIGGSYRRQYFDQFQIRELLARNLFTPRNK